MLHTKTVKKQKRGLNPLMCLPEGFSFVGREPFLERDDMLELIRNRSEDLAVFRDDKWHLNVKVEAVGLLYAVRTGSELHLRSCKAAPKFKLEFSQRSDGGSANVLHLNRLEWHNGSNFAIVKLEGSATPEMLRVLASSLMCIASDMEEYQKTATELARL